MSRGPTVVKVTVALPEPAFSTASAAPGEVVWKSEHGYSRALVARARGLQ